MASYVHRANWFSWAGNPAPAPIHAAVFGSVLAVHFGEDLTTNTPTNTQFTVTSPGANAVITASAAPGGGPRQVNLQLTSVPAAGQAVTVAYSAAGAVKVLDKNGVAAAAFAARPATNLN